LLVTEGTAFYNPLKIAKEAVVSFTHHPGTQPLYRTVATSASECLDIDLHFGISQEHCMKKFVFVSVMALASLSLVYTPTLRAQDSITIKDPAEFNAYQMATTQSDPKAKADALEKFLVAYPQSVVKKTVLDLLADTYQGLIAQAAQAKDAQGVADASAKDLSATSRLLQVDPGNLKAILYSVAIKKQQGAQTSDAQALDDAALLAQKGLTIPKPAETSADDWKKLTSAAYPVFHSAIALDDTISKKDFKAAEGEYTAELMLYTDEQAKGTGLVDTLQLAQAYVQPGDARDLVKAVWFYARVWDYAPPVYKAKIEPELERWYKKYHGSLDGLDAIKTQALATTFPPGTLVITPAKTPAEQIHDLLATTPDWNTLALTDKETVLAVGSKEDADKLWALLKDKPTPVPGTVLEATASVIKVAVTQDAKDAKTPDFVVNLKAPLADKDIPAVGLVFGLASKGQAELDGTYDTYTQIPATDTTAQSAQIALRDGVVVPEKKKAAPVRKQVAGKKPAAH
jgi:hypothetical protein